MIEQHIFYQLVKEMRQAQKDYFKYRTKAALNNSIRLEKKVDEAIKNIELPIDPQAKIFY